MSTIITHTGRLFDFSNPTLESIDIDDIAHGLSHVCRFAGHTEKFYSVAQHSVLVTHIVDTMLLQQTDKQRFEVMLDALLHDASEAWLGDVPTPLKTLLGEVYKSIESKVQGLVHTKFGLPNRSINHETLVKLADLMALKFERHHFVTFHPQEWDHIKSLPMLSNAGHFQQCWSPEEAKVVFKAVFDEIMAKTRRC